ncbi:MAG: OsmC family protein [Chloroflexota bacterium]|nr:OsmC family protein [Chloroflexota bacterium]
MAELTLAYKSRSYSTGSIGRAICNARNHHWVADDSGGEEVGAGELFFAGVSACAVNMVERLAKADNIQLDWMNVSVEAYRDPDKIQGEVTLYDDIRVHFEMWGVQDDDAQKLIELWKSR